MEWGIDVWFSRNCVRLRIQRELIVWVLWDFWIYFIDDYNQI